MPTTYGNDIVYCLKSHCGVRGYCRQKWVLQVQIICKFSNERTCKRNKDVQGLSCGFEDINRLKVVLAEKKRTNKWLCEQLNVNPSTVSKWCTNSSQPDLETLVKISHLLDVELDDLVNKKFIISQ